MLPLRPTAARSTRRDDLGRRRVCRAIRSNWLAGAPHAVPDGGPQGPPGTNGAAGVTSSADGKFVYVATEDRKTLSVFRRHSL